MMGKKLRALEFLICGILVVLLFLGCPKPKTGPTGIYLEAGGQGYVEIVKDAEDNLIINGKFAGLCYDSSWQVSFKVKNQKLILSFDKKRETETKWDSHYIYELAPSTTTPGDWDLVRAQRWRGLSNDRPSDDEIPPLKQPIPSYLHRIDDRRVVEYINLLPDYREARARGQDLGAELDIDRLSELAIGLMELHPDDLHVRTLYLDTLVRKGDYETLESRLSAWREAYTTTDSPSLRRVFLDAEHALHAMKLTAAGRNAHDFMARMISSDTDLRTRLELFPKILEYKEYCQPKSSLIFAIIPSSRHYQIRAKVFLVEAEFLMIEGKPEKKEETLRILAAIYHFGQLLNQSDTLIDCLIGIVVRSIGSEGLRSYTLNCCKTGDEFEALWEMLEELDGKAEGKDIAELLLFPWAKFMEEDFWIRQGYADVKFQLVRMAAAAQYRSVTQQEFPRSAEEFALLLPEGPPKDPFSSEPMKFLSGPNSFTCYSIGPDKQDDRASVSYDPTNGTMSPGDLFIAIPR